MRALIQRVSSARVTVDGKTVGQIKKGLLVFLGVGRADTTLQAKKLADKITLLRIFPDEHDKMNFSVAEVKGELLVVSQFTLYGDTRKGNRPSYAGAADPELAKQLYQLFVGLCLETGLTVATGVFQANMEVHSINSGPVTLFCESEP